MLGVGATGSFPTAAQGRRLRGRIVHTPFGNISDDELANAFSSRESGAGSAAATAAASASGSSYNAAEAMKRIQEQANARIGWMNNPGPMPFNGEAIRGVSELPKWLNDIDVKALKLGETSRLVADRLEAMSAAGERMRSGVAMNIDQTIATVVYGSQNIKSVFGDLMQGILQTFEEAALKAGIGLGLDFLGTAIGGPIGGFIGKVGGKLAGINSARGGGNTFVVQSIDSKSAMDAILSPTGSFRNANDRVREVAMAS